MKQLVECTHSYNGRPVKLLNYFDYLNSPEYVLILDPQSGETMKVPTDKLVPLQTLSLSSIKIMDKKEPKKESKKKSKVKKESVNEEIVDKISGFLKKRELSVRDKYNGVIKSIKDLRTLAGIVYDKDKEYFAIKEKDSPKVNVYKNSKDAIINKQVNKNYQIMPLDVFNKYFELKYENK